jgi:hypothetical protein
LITLRTFTDAHGLHAAEPRTYRSSCVSLARRDKPSIRRNFLGFIQHAIIVMVSATAVYENPDLHPRIPL